jgi:hypothetical protein
MMPLLNCLVGKPVRVVSLAVFGLLVAGSLSENPPRVSAQESVTTNGTITLGRNWKSSYVIYIGPSAPSSVRTAAEDLKSSFTKVAGLTPDIVDSVQPPTGLFISLGSNPASLAAQLDPSTIPGDGYRLVTKGNNLFILGRDTPPGEQNATGGTYTGTANGVATFIEEYLGVKRFTRDEDSEEFVKMSVVELPPLDRTDTTPFSYRTVQSTGRDTPWHRQLKLGRNIVLNHAHNWRRLVPESIFEQHPEWFAEIGGVRPKPTHDRYKIDTLNPVLVQHIATKIIANFREDPKLYSQSLSPSDGGYWGDDAASKAYTETAPNGKVSRTSLILKFYNDVAKIVGKEFPDRKLGCYIYGSYLFPPKAGIPKLEPNLSLVLATNNSYGYQLLRPTTQTEWDNMMRTWSEAAHAQGIDVYYYDLPLSLRGANGIQPAAPEMLNFIFSRVVKYGFKGGTVAGSTDIGKYLIAKLMWDPNQDATALAHEYYLTYYGPDAGPHMKKMSDVLTEAFTAFYVSHPTASYTLRPEWVDDLYGARYTEIEKYYLLARSVAKEDKYRRRIETLARPFSLLQQNLKDSGALPKTYQSALTALLTTNAGATLPGTSNVNEIGERIE